jgi:hypothetical protein
MEPVMSPEDAAKKILEIAVQSNGPYFVTNIAPHVGQTGDYQAGIDYAQQMGWIVVVGIGHFELTDAGRQAAT